MAKEFTVSMPNKPGQLATLGEALGKAGVNIEAISATTAGGKGVIRFVPSDPAKARRALRAAKIRIGGEREVLELRMQNKPGTLARMAKRLAKKRVNIDSIYLLSMSKKSATAAVGVKDLRAAKKALGR